MSPRDLRATLSALVLLPALWIALRILGLRRLAGWIERRPLAQSEIDRPTAIEEAVRAVARASRRGAGRGTCLSQSLALVHLLRIYLGWSIVIDSWSVPIWVSWIGFVVAGGLAYLGLRAIRRQFF